MANSAPLNFWRNVQTQEIRDQVNIPEHFGWEEVESDIVSGQWVVIKEAVYKNMEKTPVVSEDEKLEDTPIKGYRQLSALELGLTNKIKSVAEDVRLLIEELEAEDKKHLKTTDEESPGFSFEVDARWLSIGRTDLQKGFMELVRSITRPETF